MRGHAGTRPTRHDFERGRAPSARLAGERNAENQGEPTALVRHKLRRCPLTGSHLQLLALRYGVSVDAIRRCNEIEDGLPLSLRACVHQMPHKHFAYPLMSTRACGFPSLCTAFTWCALASAYSGYVHGHASVPLSLHELVDALDKRSLAHRVVAYSRPELSVYTSVRRQKFASTHPALRDSPHRSCLCMRRQAHPHTSVCVCVCVWVCFCSGCAFACLSNVSLCPNDAIQCRNYGARGPT